jgi:alpha-galactosidase
VLAVPPQTGDDRAVPAFEPIAEVRYERRGDVRVFEQGWQSWSPSAAYGLDDAPRRPTGERAQRLCYRSQAPAAQSGFQGEGLLAVGEGDGPVTVVAQASPTGAVPQVRGVDRGGAVEVATDRPDLVEALTIEGTPAESAGPGDDDAYALPGAMQGAIRTWAQGWAGRAGLPGVRPAPTVWCSWYQYWTEVAEPALLAEAEALAAAGLPVEVVQIDDGWQQEIGDWVERTDRFGSLAATAGRLRGLGFRTGLWTAPFFAGGQSALAREHPEWLVRGDDGEPLVVAEHWLQPLYALDATHPAAADHLRALFGGFAAAGIDYHKVDFVFAGAIEGRRHADVDGVTAYREGLRLIREAIGPEAYLLGCGAPQQASAGLVDAMRVGPDVNPAWEPYEGDWAQPGGRAARATTQARLWSDSWWVVDPDCLLARPWMEHRADWAAFVERVARSGGMVSLSDSIADLDADGMASYRRLLALGGGATPYDR